MKKPTNNIDPTDASVAANRPLWAVTAADSPNVLCCKINFSGRPVIWGFSRYQNSPKFRTLGMQLSEFISRHGNNIYFFNDINHAMDYVKLCVMPPQRILDELSNGQV